MQQVQQVQYPNAPLYNIQQDPNLEYNKLLLYQNQNLDKNQLQQHQHLVPIIYNAQLVTPTDSNDYQQPMTSAYVRDQTFEEQKVYLIKILMVFQLWSLLNIACIELFRDSLYIQLEKEPDTLLICSFFMMIILSFLGVQYRQMSAIFLLCTFISYSIAFYTGIYLCINHKNWLYKLYFGTVFISNIISNFFVNLIMVIFLVCQKNNLNIPNFIGIVLLIQIPVIFYLKWFYLFFNFSLIYSILLASSLKQILSGRHKLKKNQVMAGALAVNFGLYIPCRSDE